MRASDLIWPRLEAEDDKCRRLALDGDLSAIDRSTWQADRPGALQEARLLAEREDSRRLNTDAKASNYLLAIVALMPLLTYLESTVWEHKFGTAPKWVSLSLLAVSVAYVLGAGWWAFRTLNVGISHTFNAAELQAIWQGQNHEEVLTNEIFKNTRRNADTVNDKVSCIKMAHIFLRRGIICFGLLVLAQVGWSAYEDGWAAPRTAIQSQLGSRPEPAANVSAPLPSATAESAPSRNSCNPTELAVQRATKEMNELPSRNRFSGSVAYWVGMMESRKVEERNMGRAWERLRQIYFDVYAVECGVTAAARQQGVSPLTSRSSTTTNRIQSEISTNAESKGL